MAASAYSAPLRDRSIAEINITPLVDVMLVLLVIFMISAPTITRTLTARLPVSTPSATAPPPRLSLQVDPSGGFTLDGRSVSPAQLAEALAAIAQRSPRAIVEVGASSEADYQAFATALSIARASGIADVTLAR